MNEFVRWRIVYTMVRIYTTRMSHTKLEYYQEYIACVEDILDHPAVQQLDEFTHHNNMTRLEHCRNVGYYSYLICRKMGLDARSAARGGLLHDFFLYDWRIEEGDDSAAHIKNHPKVALENAEKYFDLNDTEREIIALHMWPKADVKPTYKETYCICSVDKYCALLEGSKAALPLARRRTAKLAFAMQSL
jgi:uncharacterized protein